MTKLTNLADIVFVDADVNTVEEHVLTEYERISGRTLATGDPVRLFLLTIANIIVMLKNDINITGKQNLLRYASGNNLDHLGALVGQERKKASSAVTTMRVSVSESMETNVIIPAGTRFTAGDNVFFSLDKVMVIAAGETIGEGQATCLEVGSVGNDYVPYQIKTLVDPVPYVSTVYNITKSEGGADEETDEDYRESIHMAPEGFSVAGPKGAYEFFTKQASALISDVSVISPEPGKVEVRPLLVGGGVPGEEILELVNEKLNADDIRPLTDQVTVLAPSVVTYNLDITYYIDNEDKVQANMIQNNVADAVKEWIEWQKAKLGRDINPSKLIRLVEDAGAKRLVVTNPGFTVVDDTSVAIVQNITVNMGGFEDG